MPDPDKEKVLLQEAECLHLQSLMLAKRAFGEDNVQTAKHYGNLGRLYQSMKLYDVSNVQEQQTEKLTSIGLVVTCYFLRRKRYTCTCAQSTSR